MRKSLLSAVVASAFLLPGTSLWAVEGVTAAEARAMLEKAIAELKADQAKALAKFRRRDSGFVDRDLYVSCYNTTDGKFTAHINPAMIGKDVRAMKEMDGSPLGQRVFDSNRARTITTIDYMYPRPGTTNPVPNQAFITVVGNQGCGTSYYK